MDKDAIINQAILVGITMAFCGTGAIANDEITQEIEQAVGEAFKGGE